MPSSILGTEVARKLVLLMDGQAGCGGGSGPGIAFWIRLPVEIDVLGAEQSAQPSKLAGRKALVFETNRHSMEVIVAGCDEMGIATETVDQISALSDALSQASDRGDVDLLILADTPTGMDIRRLAEVCQGQLGKQMPLIVFGHKREGLLLDRYDSVAFVRKPFIQRQLRDAINRVLLPGVT